MPRHSIVMLGTDFLAPGGITAVIRQYRDGGLFERWPIVFLPTYKRNSFINKLWVMATGLLKFCGWILSGQIAAVHAHTAARASFWRKSTFLLLGKLGGCRTILHLHDGTFPAYYQKCGILRRYFIRFVFSRVDSVVVLTPSWLTKFRNIQPNAKYTVIGNPVKSLTIPRNPESEEVLFLGRLWQEKGIYDLIDATAKLAEEFPDVRVICAGDGDINALQTRAKALGVLENLIFPGWVDGIAKEVLLSKATIFVLPSYYEGLPIGVLEAMINGIPVVATKVGGIPDALGEDAGLMVSPGDVNALYNALANLLRNPSLRLQMGEAGKRKAEVLYSRECVFESIGQMYRNLEIMPVAVSAVETNANVNEEKNHVWISWISTQVCR